jgi:hypothetical protein
MLEDCSTIPARIVEKNSRAISSSFAIRNVLQTGCILQFTCTCSTFYRVINERGEDVQNINGVEIHYVWNTITNAVADFKSSAARSHLPAESTTPTHSSLRPETQGQERMKKLV